MKTYFSQLCCFVLLILTGNVHGQDVVVTNLAPNFGQVNASHFSMVSLTNTGGESIRGQIVSVLMDLSGETVAELRSLNVTLAPGQTLASTDINWPRRMTYGSSTASRNFSRTGILGFGDFNMCSQFLDLDGVVRGQSCLERKSTPFVQFSLIFPVDKSEIEEDRPVLSWENVGQYGVAPTLLTYELRLVEVLPEQTPAQALETNPLLLYRKGLRSNSLLYPVSARPLHPGKTYAWTVTAVTGKQALIDAQQWVFTVAEKPQGTEQKSTGSFAMLTTQINNREYLFEHDLRIGFDNNEGLAELPYRIFNLSAQGKALKSTIPPPELVPGLNTLSIPIKELDLNTQDLYQLEIETARGQRYYLQFRIKP